jgi:hypothetical protein
VFVSNPRFISQLFNNDFRYVLNADGNRENYQSVIFQEVANFISQNVSPNLYLCNINIVYFNKVIKSYLKSNTPLTIGLEQLSKNVIENVFAHLPVSVKVVGINNLSTDCIESIVRIIKGLKTSGQDILVICGERISPEDLDKIVKINNCPVATSITITPNSTPSPTMASLIVDSGVKHKSRKRKKLEDGPIVYRQVEKTVTEQKPADLICQLVKEKTALAKQNSELLTRATSAEYKLEILCSQYNVAMARIRTLEAKDQRLEIPQFTQHNPPPNFYLPPGHYFPMESVPQPSTQTYKNPIPVNDDKHVSLSSVSSSSTSASNWTPYLFSYPASIPSSASMHTPEDFPVDNYDPDEQQALLSIKF